MQQSRCLQMSIGIIFFCCVTAALFAAPSALSMPANEKISGSFFQPWLVESWTEADWKSTFAALKASGLDDHIIWQWTADSLNKKTWYPTTCADFSKTADMVLPDPVGTSLAAAKEAGLTVWLGLNWTDDWWNKYANDAAWLTHEFDISKKIAAELWQRYGKKYASTIAGFYLTMEVDNDNFVSAEAQQRIKTVYKNVCDYIHATTKKRVMIAPFCSDSGSMQPKQWQALWENILKSAAIDIINLQDGCGASDDGKTTHVSIATVGSWFAATKCAIDAIKGRHIELWSDLETFDMDAEGNCFPAIDAGRIQRQIEAEKIYVTRFSSFSFMHYQLEASGSILSQ